MPNNHFIFSGHDTVELAEQFGTPLYVISEDKIEKAVNEIKQAFEQNQIDYTINYAGKAFLNIAMCKIANRLGINLDVVSGGELYTALKSGFDPKRITMHGSNKSTDEIKMAIEAGIGTLTIDSTSEIFLVNKIAREMGRKINVHLRLSPGVEAHTHEYVQTGRVDSKFGIPISMGTRAARMALDSENLNLTGLHCHIGSQIYSWKPFQMAATAMLEMIFNIKEMGVELKELNLGGGFGINYLHDDPVFDVSEYITSLAETLHKQCALLGIDIPKIIVEPGRYIVGPAGITLYSVGTVKEIPFLRKYVSVDGGMADNPRPLLYNAVHHAVVANKYDCEPNDLVTISGKCCETDTLIKDILIPQCERGDIIAVMNTGAYNYSMASHYNRLAVPAVVLLKGDRAEIIVKRDSYENLVINDMVPSWLEEE
jgi:diaminopimelate decarboxylase